MSHISTDYNPNLQPDMLLEQAIEGSEVSTKLIKNTILVSAMTMISRLMGFIRDIILAQFFGAGAAFDAFVIAFKIPNFLRRLSGEGALSQAFVPVLVAYRTQQTQQRLIIFISNIIGCMSVVWIAVIIAVELCIPAFILVFAPGFREDPLRLQLTQHMLRIILPYCLLISLSALAAAILNTYHRFALSSVSSVLLNIALIAAAWGWAPHANIPIYVLAWGVVIGGALQLALLIPPLYKMQLLALPKFDWYDVDVRRVMKKMLPALFGVSVAQLSMLLDNFFASFLPAGSISWLYYSDRLMYLPLGVIGVAVATVVMPTLSRQHCMAIERSNATVDWALRCILIMGVPAAVGLFMLAGPLLATLVYHGAFTIKDVVMTQKSLAAFALGLPAFMLIKILVAAFYSRRLISIPVKIAAIAISGNIVLNTVLIWPLAHTGLALSTSIASWLNALLLLIWLIKRHIYRPQSGWMCLLIRLLVANMLMAVFLKMYSYPLMQWLNWGVGQRILHLCGVIIMACCLYFAVLWVTGIKLRTLTLTLSRKR